MGEKIIVGPITKGLRQDVTAFNIDNDNFPVLTNAYQWRGRVKRKRGTSLFGRLTRYFNSLLAAFNPGTTTQTLSSGAGNLLTGFTNSGIQSTANIVPGSVTINDETASVTYTDTAKDGTLAGTPSGSGTINYATGAITISGGASDVIDALFQYYPNLPVLGLESVVLDPSSNAGELGFDQTYSYNLSLSVPYSINDVSFYNNPASATINTIAYTQKTSWTPLKWNLQNYQQVWTTNYQGALWATPGIPSPFSITNIGMQFKPMASITYVSATQVTVTITETAASLVIGDWVFINEVTGTDSNSVNFQTGFVTAVANGGVTTTLTVRLPYATVANQVYSNGILQYLTNNSDKTKDCLRWYNGAPVSSASPPVFAQGVGWVNFCPPLVTTNFAEFSIDDLPEGQYYLVGAVAIVPYKDRLLFFGPVVQTSTGSPKYLQDTVIYSQNGTPYYTASFTGPPAANVTYYPMIVPTNQTAAPSSFWENLAGYGGFISAGYAQAITTVSPNEDALIVGFTDRQTRFLYTGNDIVPFNFYVINSEFGSASTFSTTTLDRGVLSVGGRGIIITSQTSSQRIDLEIPDDLFQFDLQNQGFKRVCTQRDFQGEWVYFTYSPSTASYIYPGQTLFYNYRDGSWAIWDEAYTTYGIVRLITGYTWATIGMQYPTWQSWNSPWSSGESNVLQPIILGGNQQGFIMVKDFDGTAEGTSLYIQNIASGSIVTSPSNCLNDGDYIVISGCLGTVGAQVNKKIFSVSLNQASNDTFQLNPPIAGTVGTYLGGGVIKRMYVPQVMTRQFPVKWEMGRRTRLGPQQYLLTRTPNGQVTLYIFLSQNADFPYNSGSIVPQGEPEPLNSGLIYSTILFTCPEYATQTTNNTYLGTIGNGSTTTFALSLAFPLVPGSLYIIVGSVATFQDVPNVPADGTGTFTVTGTGASGTVNYQNGAVSLVFSSAPTSQPVYANYQYYYIDIQNPTAASQNQIWHRINTSLIGDTVQIGFTLSDAQMRDTAFSNQFVEIEIHSMILDVSPSQLLC